MKHSMFSLPLVVCGTLVAAQIAQAQDWPQWRGPNRDGKASAFKAPATWPTELKQEWKIDVGEGVATPSLVGNKLYVFSRQEGNEILRCLDASTGKELWKDQYESLGAEGPARGFSGPRSSPTVADGKVITLGVRGTLTCLEAESGKVLWRKQSAANGWPRFFASCSPLIASGMCLAQSGEESEGAVVAYDLGSGDEKWRWAEDGTAYASPMLLALGDDQVVVAETAKSIVGLRLKDGTLLWKIPYEVEGRGYNAATPLFNGDTIIYSGSNRGTKAVKIAKEGDAYKASDLWNNAESSVQYNSPVLKNGFVYGLSSRDSLFCLSALTGETTWTAPINGQRGFGSIVDAGSVLFALTPKAELVVFEPNEKAFKQVASFKVADGETHAHPVVVANRIFIKDSQSVALYTVQ